MSSLAKENRKILLVDDEEDILELLAAYLRSKGWEVSVAASPHKALKTLSSEEFFLIITDIAMPEMDGYELITSIRSMKCRSKIALMTGFGYNPKHTLVKINRKEKLPVFFKPFEFKNNNLSEAVEKLNSEYLLEVKTLN